MDRAELVLGIASARVRAAAGDPTWTTIPDAAVGVTLQLAARMYGNPTGVRSQSSGPFSQTFELGLTPAETAALGALTPVGNRLWTMTTYRGDLSTPEYLPVEGSDKPIPT